MLTNNNYQSSTSSPITRLNSHDNQWQIKVSPSLLYLRVIPSIFFHQKKIVAPPLFTGILVNNRSDIPSISTSFERSSLLHHHVAYVAFHPLHIREQIMPCIVDPNIQRSSRQYLVQQTPPRSRVMQLNDFSLHL